MTRRWLTAGPALLALLLLLATACGGGNDTPAPAATGGAAPTRPPTPAAPPVVAPAATVPAAAPGTGAPNHSDLAAAGRALFTGGGGCSACHTIDGTAQGVLGPDQSRIGAQAAARIPGYTAEQYIRESITDPCAYTVTPADAGITRQYDCNLMVATMSGISLSETDIDALVAFLLQQR